MVPGNRSWPSGPHVAPYFFGSTLGVEVHHHEFVCEEVSKLVRDGLPGQGDHLEEGRLQGQAEEWDGRRGYVQGALEADGVSAPGATGALMCGMKGMAEAVKEALVEAGVDEGKVLTNF